MLSRFFFEFTFSLSKPNTQLNLAFRKEKRLTDSQTTFSVTGKNINGSVET